MRTRNNLYGHSLSILGDQGNAGKELVQSINTQSIVTM